MPLSHHYIRNMSLQTSVKETGSYLGLLGYAAASRNNLGLHLSAVYTGDNTLNVVAVASDGDLKRWEDFY
jgi:hypothetical protein